jgi:hypothetical protein
VARAVLEKKIFEDFAFFTSFSQVSCPENIQNLVNKSYRGHPKAHSSKKISFLGVIDLRRRCLKKS